MAHREVGDGNLNLVFIAEGQADVVVKHALPYARLPGGRCRSKDGGRKAGSGAHVPTPVRTCYHTCYLYSSN